MAFNKKGEDWQADNDDDGYHYIKQNVSVDITDDIYMYCTGASPTDTKFKEHNGAVYVICVARGQCRRADNADARWYGPDGGDGTSEACYWFMDYLKWELCGDEFLKNYLQLPTSYDTKEGTHTNYSIAFSETFNLFKDNGNTTFSLNANYQQTFSLDQFSQTSTCNEGLYYMGFSVDYNNLYDRAADPEYKKDSWKDVFDKTKDKHTVKSLPQDNIPVHGLSVFKSEELKKVKFYLTSEFGYVGFRSDTAWSKMPTGNSVLPPAILPLLISTSHLLE
ncbi:hypothetical protein BT96DRAFT_436296 [Gymnopus androsaceus JB14]|uniref:Uncharacterized protein n=1 Tax=Gymnopus androsaceus JB14 TaxID=1447944 RepID=A0A6A4GRL0_9AGAR|nr:hypothetical protein BT96DRAFT_436296 [Gymnopus androsaceus JB14]